jgi:hypothetical protein
MDHLIQEVDEELRRERLHQLWHNFGRHIVVISICILLFTAGVVAWQSHQASLQQKWTDILLNAQEMMDEGEIKNAIALLERTSPAMEGELRTIAHIWLAQLYLGSNDPKKADEVIARIQANGNSDYTAVAQLFSSAPADSKSNTTFHILMQEKQAINLLDTGKKIDAIASLRSIEEDATTPDSMRARINLLLLQIEGKNIEPKPAANTKIIPAKTDITKSVTSPQPKTH